jgi:ABC-2 type transport system ATP-binding protein
MSIVIRADNLTKKFRVFRKLTSRWGKISSYFYPQYGDIVAVDNISFEINKGERVAFIGPNGAGKSTTIKMLTGIVMPTHGGVSICDYDPFIDREFLSYNIGVVFGSNFKLWNNITVQDNFDLTAAVYDIDRSKYNSKLKKLIDKFDINTVLTIPFSKLSLGQKMRCELVATLLYSPQVLLMDEPTIGLDIVAKSVIRKVLKENCTQDGNTLILTSHDVKDIEEVCDRVIVIDKGKIILDSTIIQLKKDYIKTKIISIVSNQIDLDFTCEGTFVLQKNFYTLKIEINLEKISIQEVVYKLMNQFSIVDLSIEDPSLESILALFYKPQTT